MAYKALNLTMRAAEKLLDAACKTATSLKFAEGPVPWSHILHADGHPAIAKELADMRRVADKRAESAGEVGDEAWHDKQLAEMTKAGFTFSVMDADPRVASLKANPWFDALTEREQASMAHLMAVAPDFVCVDISQSLDRIAKPSTSRQKVATRSASSTPAPSAEDDSGLCRTLIVRSTVWYGPLQRCLTASEKCALQCIPVNVMTGASQIQPRSLTTLAGEAFNGAAFSAMLLGLLVHTPVRDLACQAAEAHEDEQAFLSQLVWADAD